MTLYNPLYQKRSDPITETARMENIHLGRCPICNEPMQIATAGPQDIKVYVCEAHKVCLPVED